MSSASVLPAGRSATTETLAYTLCTNRLATVKSGGNLRSSAADAEGDIVSASGRLMPGLGAAMGGLGNRIVAEIDDATGATAREYLWLGDRVVAVAPAGPSSATLYFVTTDHLMRPVQMTGASKAVVWRAKYGPFGELLETTGPASLSARYPGQWFQLENGLAWNWHRHYDASLGRAACSCGPCGPCGVRGAKPPGRVCVVRRRGRRPPR